MYDLETFRDKDIYMKLHLYVKKKVIFITLL